jgi:hypothetical protein
VLPCLARWNEEEEKWGEEEEEGRGQRGVLSQDLCYRCNKAWKECASSGGRGSGVNVRMWGWGGQRGVLSQDLCCRCNEAGRRVSAAVALTVEVPGVKISSNPLTRGNQKYSWVTSCCS